ncbi:MAG: amidohydrolase family protein [Anaerolineae bacterium]|nr:amidohydrolase family protein [Anaerolineae bacterium]
MSQESVLIRNGTIMDGTGSAPFLADLLVENGRIAEIFRDASLSPRSPDLMPLDAAGLVVAPGFIDIHSHSDFTLVADPRAVSSISQGATLEVIGNCGHGCAPVTDPAQFSGNIYGYRPDVEIHWHSVGEYLDRVAQLKPSVNVAALVPNGNLRLAVAGLVDRPSTRAELDRMQALLAEGMQEGAFGYSTGLEYGPERACPEEEIAALARVAAKYGGFYATHTRNQGDGAEAAIETIAEAVRTGGAADIPLQISHISIVSRLAHDGHWAVQKALEQVDVARGRGQDVTFDMHTRLFGTTNLSEALPPQALEGSTREIAARLSDPATRRELKKYNSIITALARDDWSRIVIFDSKLDPEISRQSIADISAARGTEPFDTIYDILLAHVENIHELMIIAFAYNENDIRPAFKHSLCMVGSDATALATDGLLAGTSFHGAFTWAGWYYSHFVRDTRTFTPQEAIRRMTSLPASRLGLTDRGTIKQGAYADLAIFDPETFAERGTTFEPNQTAQGMRHVMVNGVLAVRDGQLTGQRSGQVLKHN